LRLATHSPTTITPSIGLEGEHPGALARASRQMARSAELPGVAPASFRTLSRASGLALFMLASRRPESPAGWLLVCRELGLLAGEISRAHRSRGELERAHEIESDLQRDLEQIRARIDIAPRRKVKEDLRRRCSPEQIVGRLRRQFPDDPEMRVSPETNYQSLYVQSRGALRRDLTKCLRTGRALRRPRRQPKNRIPDMINISERPAEAGDRAVPGHGDLTVGKNNLSAIGTLVERTTGYRCSCTSPAATRPSESATR
jgi:hypothetical protein